MMRLLGFRSCVGTNPFFSALAIELSIVDIDIFVLPPDHLQLLRAIVDTRIANKIQANADSKKSSADQVAN